MKIRTCDDAACSAAGAINESVAKAWANCSSISNSGSLISESGSTCVTPGDQWIQYQATLSEATTTTPSLALDEVRLTKVYYPTQTLTSSTYDSSMSSNIISALSWNEDNPSGTEVKFQLATAPCSNGATNPPLCNSGTWTYVGPDGTDGTFFTNSSPCSKNGTTVTCTAASGAIPAAIRDGENDRYFRYKATLTSAGANTPTLSDLTITYIVNRPPTISSFATDTNQEAATGKLNDITYTFSNGGFGDDSEPGDTFQTALFYTTDYVSETNAGMKLASSIGPGSTSLQVTGADGAYLPAANGYIQIDNEVIKYATKTGSSSPFTLNNLTRGTWVDDSRSTVAATHNANAAVYAQLSNSAIVTTSGGAGIGNLSVAGDVDDKTYVLSWDAPNDDLFNTSTTSSVYGRYESNMRLKVSINDGNSANQFVTAASSRNVSIDTAKITADNNPSTYTAVKIDGRRVNGLNADQARITLKAQDDSDIEFMYSLNSDLTPDGVNPDSGEWIELNTADSNAVRAGTFQKTITLAPENNFKVDTVYVKYRDQFHNENPATYSVTVPERPTAMMIQDITNTRTDPWDIGLFITWKATDLVDGPHQGQFAKYTLEKARLDNPNPGVYPANEDFTFSVNVTPQSAAINHYTDRAVPYDQATNQNYFYRVYVTDGVGNVSYYSSTDSSENAVLQGIPNGTQDPFEGGGGTSGVPAVIEDVEHSDITTTSALIKWKTDMLTTSTVGYSTTPGDFSNEIGYGSYNTSHRITLPALAPNRTYYYRVKSTNVAAITSMEPTSGNGRSFATLAGDSTPPVISNPNEEGITQSSATITWTTDEDATSFVEYSKTYNFSQGTHVGNFALTRNHSVRLENLETDTTYYYKIRSKDAVNNEAVSAQRNFRTLESTGDETPPEIDNISAGTPLYNTATITWTTNEPASSYVDFGLTPSYGRTYGSETLRENHSVTLPKDLAPDTVYHFRVRSRDASRNEAKSADATFQTAADPNDTEAPEIYNIELKDPTTTGITVKWTTNEDATSYVGYSLDRSYVLEQGYSLMDTGHQVTLVGLNPGTFYYLRVKSTDPSGNTATENQKDGTYLSFSTQPGPVPPRIENISITDVTYNSAKISWTTNINSTSLVEYGLDQNYGRTFGSFAKTKNHSVTLGNLLSSATYHFRARSADETEGVSGNFTFTTAAAPDDEPPAIDHIQVINITTDSATITWTTSEPTDSIVSYGPTSSYGSLAGSSETLKTSHAVDLANLAAGTTYHFQIRAKDASQNIKYSSNQTFATNPDITPPVIESVEAQVISPSAALVRWTTNEEASSQVVYSLGERSYNLSSSQLTTFKKFHSILLTGLESNSKYYFKVRSRDKANNLAESGEYDFTTQLPLEFQHDPLSHIGDISDPPAVLTDNKAVIRFVTYSGNEGNYVKQAARCLIEYGTQSGNYNEVPVTESDYNVEHAIHLAGLVYGTQYFYKITCEDNLESIVYAEERSFRTTDRRVEHPDLANPGNPEVIQVSDTEATIVLPVTNANSTSKICYAKTEITDMDNCPNYQQIAAPTRTHWYQLTGLESDTAYYARVRVRDLPSEKALREFISENISFTTLAAPAEHENLTNPGNPKVIQISDTEATIALPTVNTQAVSKLCYGKTAITNVNNCDRYQEITAATRTHWYHLTGLAPNTLYHFRIKTVDSKNKDLSFTSGHATFTTLETQYGASQLDAILDKEKPKISDVKIANVGGENATITWTTDENANSLVKYGLTKEYESVAGNKLVISKTDEYVTSHSVNINYLIPSTRYYFSAISIDAAGNIAESAQGTFTTRSPSNISSIKVTSKNLNSVTVSWETNVVMSSILEYGLDENYGEKVESSTRTKRHEMIISGLESNRTYHLRVKGKDLDGNLYSSADYTFEPKSPPRIENIKVEKVQEHSALIKFNTDTPTDSLVSFVNTEDADDAGTQGKSELAKDHAVELKNLKPGKEYKYTIRVRDADGNENTSEEAKFTTGKDENPPKIDQIRTDSALAQGDKVQSIISWITDEPSTTELLYREGLKSENKEVIINKNFTTNHVAVITTFRPGTVYYFNTRSTDQSGNTAVSSDFALLTPKRKDNIVQIIITNFQQIFGWAKF